VLDTGATVSDTLQIVVYDVFSVADTVSASDGGSFGGNVGVGGTLSVTGNVISPITLAGTTPTLTIGDAGAEDTKIVFDGNAQDYHIGLDDSTDSLTIGLGSALGTTSHMVIDANGHVTKPLQPAFLILGATTDNVGNNETINFSTERFDLGSDFASNTFTAPVTGRYQFNVNLNFNGFDQDFTYIRANLVTSNYTYELHIVQGNMADDDGYMHFGGSIIADLDANDTSKVVMEISGGAAQMDLMPDAGTQFSGYLVC